MSLANQTQISQYHRTCNGVSGVSFLLSGVCCCLNQKSRIGPDKSHKSLFFCSFAFPLQEGFRNLNTNNTKRWKDFMLDSDKINYNQLITIFCELLLGFLVQEIFLSQKFLEVRSMSNIVFVLSVPLANFLALLLHSQFTNHPLKRYVWEIHQLCI